MAAIYLHLKKDSPLSRIATVTTGGILTRKTLVLRFCLRPLASDRKLKRNTSKLLRLHLMGQVVEKLIKAGLLGR